jgi:hypothetical protein
MRKKPGGQPNNRNAFKHGFYSKYFSPFESRTLSEIPTTDLSGEIGLLRVNVDRFMQSYTDSLDDLDYADRLAGLRAITLAVGRIAALQRILSFAGKNLAESDRIMEMLMKFPEDDPDDRSCLDDIMVEEPPTAGDHDPEG